MNYTQPIPMNTTLLKKHELSAEAKAIKQYVATHDVSVTFNQENSPVIKFTEK